MKSYSIRVLGLLAFVKLSGPGAVGHDQMSIQAKLEKLSLVDFKCKSEYDTGAQSIMPVGANVSAMVRGPRHRGASPLRVPTNLNAIRLLSTIVRCCLRRDYTSDSKMLPTR
jgi:hypothetical protein